MTNQTLRPASLILLLTPALFACTDASTDTGAGSDTGEIEDTGETEDIGNPEGTVGAEDSGEPEVTGDSDEAELTGTTERTLSVDGVERTYLLTVPESTTGDDLVPLLLNLHPLQGSAEGQLASSGFEPLAEREGFLVATPQALDGMWTVTGFPLNSGSDDRCFLIALVDELSATLNVDSERIYATGMSQGGMLSLDLVCGSGPSLAAIAPVSGVMTPGMTETCSPPRPIPVLQVHGTDDVLVDYEAAEAVVEWWVAFNDADTTPMVSSLPDTFPDNGTTVDQFIYAGGASGGDVVHLRINGGGHDWPGSAGDSDVDIAEAIWGFLSQYDLDGRVDE